MSLDLALFSAPPLPGWCQAICTEAERRGHRLALVETFDPAQRFDSAWLRIFPDHHADAKPNYWRAAEAYEASGLPLLNSSTSRALTHDKLALDAALRLAGLRSPESWAVGAAPTDAFPLVCKPRSGSRGRDVVIVDGPQAADRHQHQVGRPCLLQRIIPTARCLRVVATPERVIAAYQKQAGPDQFVLSVALGAEREAIVLDDALAGLARAMVAAIDADLCGCDILEDADGRRWALEINSSFAFDPDNRAISSGFVDRLEALADRS